MDYFRNRKKYEMYLKYFDDSIIQEEYSPKLVVDPKKIGKCKEFRTPKKSKVYFKINVGYKKYFKKADLVSELCEKRICAFLNYKLFNLKTVKFIMENKKWQKFHAIYTEFIDRLYRFASEEIVEYLISENHMLLHENYCIILIRRKICKKSLQNFIFRYLDQNMINFKGKIFREIEDEEFILEILESYPEILLMKDSKELILYEIIKAIPFSQKLLAYLIDINIDFGVERLGGQNLFAVFYQIMDAFHIRYFMYENVPISEEIFMDILKNYANDIEVMDSLKYNQNISKQTETL